MKFLLVKRSSHQLRQILRMSSPRLTLSHVHLQIKPSPEESYPDVTYKHRAKWCFATDVSILNDTFMEENSHTEGTLTHVNVPYESVHRRERLRQRLVENSGLCVTSVVLQMHSEPHVDLFAVLRSRADHKNFLSIRRPGDRSAIHECQPIRWKCFTDIDARITHRFESFIAPRASAVMNAKTRRTVGKVKQI